MFLQDVDRPANLLLDLLPEAAYQRLESHLQEVNLAASKILYHAGESCDYAYFPTHSIVCLVATMENGATTEIGIVGSEGMVGLPILFDTTHTASIAIVQIGGSSLRIAASHLREEFNRQGALQSLLLRYIQARLIQVGQIAACNRYHSVEQRFARWLLMVRDGLQSDRFYLTQEFISQMLGVRRPGITTAAIKFQKAGIIRYKRGAIAIISPKELEAHSCECYRVVANEFSKLLTPKL